MLKKLVRYSLVLLGILMMTACGGGSGSSSGGGSSNSSNWDQMVWDQNNWA